jgi:MoaA/NifB/PqqE/SkfB family radical SAM enzyme
MDFDFFKRVMKECKELGTEEVGVFYIGESFMNQKLLIDAIKYLKDELKMGYVFLTSNASLATPDKVKAVMEAGLDSLKWSVNAYDEEQYVKTFHVKPAMMQIAKDNIKAAWDIRNANGYSTTISASSIKYDDAQLVHMKGFLEENIIPYVDKNYWLPLYTGAGQTIDKTGFKPTAGNSGTIDEPVDPLPCWTVFTEGHIMVDGRMSACCLDANGTWVMGDLTKQSFMEAWNSKQFQDLRAAHLRKDVSGTICEKCAMYS